MHMIGHDDVAVYKMSLPFQIVKPLVHDVVPVHFCDERQPPVTGKSYEKRTGCVRNGSPDGHEAKVNVFSSCLCLGAKCRKNITICIIFFLFTPCLCSRTEGRRDIAPVLHRDSTQHSSFTMRHTHGDVAGKKCLRAE